MEGQDSVICSAFQIFRRWAQCLLAMRIFGGQRLRVWGRRVDFCMSMKTWRADSQTCCGVFWRLSRRKCFYIRKNKMCRWSTESFLISSKEKDSLLTTTAVQCGTEYGTKEPRQNPSDPTLTRALFDFSFFPKSRPRQHANFGMFFFLFQTLTQNFFLYIDFHCVKMGWAVKIGLRKVIFH